MNKLFAFFLCMACLLLQPGCKDQAKTSGKYIIEKENGRICTKNGIFRRIPDH
jgi:hypothetical protein